MNVSLTPKLEEFIQGKVETGFYNNASEVVREALRLLVQRESQVSPSLKATEDSLQKSAVAAKLLQLQPLLRKRGLVSLSLFGSVVHDKATPDSDVDVLIQVASKRRFSLIDLAGVKNLLEERLGREVDVVTKDSLDPHIRDRVLSEALQVF